NEVDIAPTTIQNLLENETGTMLTATENPTATSREWKFSTTSGSGYTSFATAQTGMTYAPQFASIGTYYVVCESDFNGQATISNEVTIIVSANSIDISPTTTQNIFENQAGNALTANETPTATNREWKFSTTSGSGYTSFATAETGTSYTPLFFTAGTYYVVCEANFNGTMVTSNEVTIIVSVSVIPTVSITPASTQDIAANELGSVLTVNESEPSTSREWKFSMTSGSGYASFATVQTGNNYTPQFSTDGSFYIVCQSMINGSMITSNEVQINVTTFENNINPDYAQGVYLNQPVTTLEIEESIPADNRIWKIGTVAGGGYNPFTPNETGTTITPVFDVVGSYFIICQSTLNGNTVTSNEIEIQVFEPNTIISPSSFQNLYENEQGNQLTIVETPVATSREWKYAPSTTGTYQSFATAETGTNYTPFFADAGIYYVRCESEIYGNTYISNTITITVNEYMTSIAPTDEQTIIVNTDGDMITVAENTNPTAREWKFSTTSGGTYTSFSSTETSTNYTPNFDTEGTYYVVCESNFNGTILTSNEVKINVIALPTISISPTDEQNITANQFGNTLFLETGNNTPNAAEWLYSTTSGVGYTSFMTNETADQYKPLFDTEGTYYVVCDAEILNETYRSNEVIINVSEPVGIFDYEKADFAVYSFDKNIVIDLSQKEMKNATISIINIEGKIVFEKVLESYTTNRIELPTIQEGIYFYSIRNVDNQFNGKLLLK
ncbi:MAG: T9SS type A sorting domain-containing protein, partial [Chitinophagales bacterium]